jgi:hypothetical protein
VFTKPLDVKGFKAFMAAFEAENDNAVGEAREALPPDRILGYEEISDIF